MNKYSVTILPALAFAAIVLLNGCGGKWDPSSAADLAREFEYDFGVPPPTDIRGLKCRVVNVGDTSSRWFSFECSKETFGILVGNGFEVAERAKLGTPWLDSKGALGLIDPYERNVNAPEWWPDVQKAQFERLYYRMKKKDSSNSYLFIFSDKLSGKIYAGSAVWR